MHLCVEFPQGKQTEEISEPQGPSSTSKKHQSTPTNFQTRQKLKFPKLHACTGNNGIKLFFPKTSSELAIMLLLFAEKHSMHFWLPLRCGRIGEFHNRIIACSIYHRKKFVFN